MSQLFEDGKVINVDGAELECVGVSYQEIDGERRNFVYNFRLKTEVEAEREATAKAEAERVAAEQAAKAEQDRIASEATEAPAPVTEPVEQPEVNKEETLNVK